MSVGFNHTKRFPSQDFYFDIADDRDHTLHLRHIFGRNAAVGTSWEDVWNNGGVYVWPTSALTLEAISADADDTAAGAGAQVIRIEGLDANWDAIEEELVMAGTNATSATSQSFIRVNHVEVVRAGTYGNTDNGPNQGQITIRFASVGATQCLIGSDGNIGMGHSAIARYSVSRNHTVFLTGYLANVESSKAVETVLWERSQGNDVSAPYTGTKRMVLHIDGEAGAIAEDFHVPLAFNGYTDIWWSMKAAVGSSGSVDFSLIIKDDTLDPV